MLNTPLQRTLFYIGLAFFAANLSRAALHLPDWSEFVFSAGAILCLLAVFVIGRGKSLHRPSTSIPRKTGVRLFALLLIIVVSLSGPWWLPYTGVHLAFPQLAAVSLITCTISVAMWFIAWHRAKAKA